MVLVPEQVRDSDMSGTIDFQCALSATAKAGTLYLRIVDFSKGASCLPSELATDQRKAW